MYIQPCCINRELPELMRATPFTFFQSNGDWVLKDLMAAVGFLVPECTCLIAIPEVDVFLLRVLNTYLMKGWYRSLVLLTHDNQEGLVREVLSVSMEKVTYACNKQLMDGAFALSNGKHHLLVQGPLLLEKDFTLCQYAGYFGSDAAVLYSGIESLTAKVKTGAFVRSEEEMCLRMLNKRL